MDAGSNPLDKARALVTARRFDEALRLLADYPDDALGRFFSATAYVGKNDEPKALVEIERSIGLQPDFSEAHAIRSYILSRLERNRASLEAAREAVRLDPVSPVAQFYLAHAASLNRSWKVAEAAAAETVRLAPDWSAAHAVVGDVARRRRQRQRAQEKFREALELDPNNPYILNDLALTYSRLRPRDETIKLMEQAVRLDPSDKVLANNLYFEARGHVGGGGFDRVDLIIWPAFFVSVALSATIFFGWVHPPRTGQSCSARTDVHARRRDPDRRVAT